MAIAESYCAICSGATFEVRISERPRSERFKAAVAAKRLDPSKTSAEDCLPDLSEDERASVDEELWSFSNEIISEEETEWARTVKVLAVNTHVSRNDQ